MSSFINDSNGDAVYELINPLKSGGFGTVYNGKIIDTGEKVAIKTMAIFDPNYIDALKRELDIASKLSHRNIVETIAAGYNAKDNVFYVVMKYYKNGSLDEVIRNATNDLEIKECVRYFMDLLDGFEYAHKILIHRDIKPANILIGDNNELRICDFGMAKYVGDTTYTFSYKGGGTYAYMAPEAWSNEQNTIGMDIYSLGILFFEILTRKKPFNAASALEYKDLHLFEPFPTIDAYRSNVPVKIKEIIYKMTNKRRSQRYSNVAEIIDALKAVNQQIAEQDETAEGLANLANAQVERQKALIAERERQENQETFRSKGFNYCISELTTKIEVLINATNSRLEQNKIVLTKTKNREGLNELSLKFMSKTLSLSVFGKDDIKNYEENMRKRSVEFQKNKYGTVMQAPSYSIFSKERITLVGKLSISGSIAYSLNLLLKKEKDTDDYGEWYMAIFNDSGFGRGQMKTNYGLERDEFYKEYESSRTTMHIRSVEVKKIVDEEIAKWLQMVLI
jgi:serine/threonine protein kinase